MSGGTWCPLPSETDDNHVLAATRARLPARRAVQPDSQFLVVPRGMAATEQPYQSLRRYLVASKTSSVIYEQTTELQSYGTYVRSNGEDSQPDPLLETRKLAEPATVLFKARLASYQPPTDRSRPKQWSYAT